MFRVIHYGQSAQPLDRSKSAAQKAHRRGDKATLLSVVHGVLRSIPGSAVHTMLPNYLVEDAGYHSTERIRQVTAVMESFHQCMRGIKAPAFYEKHPGAVADVLTVFARMCETSRSRILCTALAVTETELRVKLPVPSLVPSPARGEAGFLEEYARVLRAQLGAASCPPANVVQAERPMRQWSVLLGTLAVTKRLVMSNVWRKLREIAPEAARASAEQWGDGCLGARLERAVADLEVMYRRSNDNQGVRMMVLLCVGFLFSRAAEADVPFAAAPSAASVQELAVRYPEFERHAFDMHVSRRDNRKKMRTLTKKLGLELSEEELLRVAGPIDISAELASFGGLESLRFFEEGARIADGQEYGQDPYLPIVRAARTEAEEKGAKRNRSAKQRERFMFTGSSLAEWAEPVYGKRWAEKLREASVEKKKVARRSASDSGEEEQVAEEEEEPVPEPAKKRRKGEGKLQFVEQGGPKGEQPDSAFAGQPPKKKRAFASVE